MTDHTPAEQACFAALVTHNGPVTSDDPPYPACLWPLAVAAARAVLGTIEGDRA